MNPYLKYYEKQIGSGVAVYSGVRYQKGNGFFGRLLKGAVVPMLRFLGKQGLQTMGEVASEVLNDPEQMSSIVKRKLSEAGGRLLEEGGGKLLEEAAKRVRQMGDGVRRKRRATVKRFRRKIPDPKRTNRKRRNIAFLKLAK